MCAYYKRIDIIGSYIFKRYVIFSYLHGSAAGCFSLNRNRKTCDGIVFSAAVNCFESDEYYDQGKDREENKFSSLHAAFIHSFRCDQFY